MSGYQEVNAETWVEIAGILKQIIFREMFSGKVLMDNSNAFHSGLLNDMVDKWNIRHDFRTVRTGLLKNINE